MQAALRSSVEQREREISLTDSGPPVATWAACPSCVLGQRQEVDTWWVRQEHVGKASMFCVDSLKPRRWLVAFHPFGLSVFAKSLHHPPQPGRTPRSCRQPRLAVHRHHRGARTRASPCPSYRTAPWPISTIWWWSPSARTDIDWR